jgi:hypothetical protein
MLLLCGGRDHGPWSQARAELIGHHADDDHGEAEGCEHLHPPEAPDGAGSFLLLPGARDHPVDRER